MKCGYRGALQHGSAGFTMIETVVALAVGMLVLAVLGSLTAVGLTRGLQLQHRVSDMVGLQQLTRRIQQQAAELHPPFWQSPEYFSQHVAEPDPQYSAGFARDSRDSVYGWQISIEYAWLVEPIILLAPFGSRPLE